MFRWLVEGLCWIARFQFYKRRFQHRIGPKGLVLDVGSGNDPHPRANVLCDLALWDDTDRIGPLKHHGLPLVIADVAHLPFRDQVFDFVNCSHVLEHVVDVRGALLELMRIARRGYLEFPSEFLEKLASQHSHKWFIRQENGALHFTRKQRPIFDETLVTVARQMVQWKDPTYRLWVLSHGGFVIQFPWEGTIPFEIHDLSEGQIEKEAFAYAEPSSKRLRPEEESSVKRWFKGGVRKLVTMPMPGRHTGK